MVEAATTIVLLGKSCEGVNHPFVLSTKTEKSSAKNYAHYFEELSFMEAISRYALHYPSQEYRNVPFFQFQEENDP